MVSGFGVVIDAMIREFSFSQELVSFDVWVSPISNFLFSTIGPHMFC